tara:strand:+ start:5754 stop:6086 length:333 start_codon:yes stop_codon:yes gene_type:complete
MNKNKLKQIHRKTESLLVDWLRSMVSDEEADRVSTKNVMQFMPETEIYAPVKSGIRCVPMTPRWIKKELKKMLQQDSNLDVEAVTLDDLNLIAYEQRASVHRRNIIDGSA